MTKIRPFNLLKRKHKIVGNNQIGVGYRLLTSNDNVDGKLVG